MRVEMANCSVCARKIVPTIGPETSKILIIGSRPDVEDVNKGMPFVGTRGEVLFGEFSRVGLPLQRMRMCYLYNHFASGEDCDNLNIPDVLREMKDKDGILLIGAEVCEGLKVGQVSHLIGLEVSSFYFPKSAKFVMATLNPPINDFIGEFRLSIEKFAKKLKEVQNG